jgi:hypothetical protein
MSETTSMDIVFAAAIARDAKSLEADVTVHVASPGCGALFRHVFRQKRCWFSGFGKNPRKIRPTNFFACDTQAVRLQNQPTRPMFRIS